MPLFYIDTCDEENFIRDEIGHNLEQILFSLHRSLQRQSSLRTRLG